MVIFQDPQVAVTLIGDRAFLNYLKGEVLSKESLTALAGRLLGSEATLRSHQHFWLPEAPGEIRKDRLRDLSSRFEPCRRNDQLSSTLKVNERLSLRPHPAGFEILSTYRGGTPFVAMLSLSVQILRDKSVPERVDVLPALTEDCWNKEGELKKPLFDLPERPATVISTEQNTPPSLATQALELVARLKLEGTHYPELAPHFDHARKALRTLYSGLELNEPFPVEKCKPEGLTNPELDRLLAELMEYEEVLTRREQVIAEMCEEKGLNDKELLVPNFGKTDRRISYSTGPKLISFLRRLGEKGLDTNSSDSQKLVSRALTELQEPAPSWTKGDYVLKEEFTASLTEILNLIKEGALVGNRPDLRVRAKVIATSLSASRKSLAGL